MIGAFYYPWYTNDNWQHKCVRGLINPQHKPVLGWYHSHDPKVIKQHLKWCDEYGIDFLSVSYNNDDNIGGSIDLMLKIAEENNFNVKITMHFETLSFFDDNPVVANNSKAIEFVKRVFVPHFKNIAINYANKPNWLTINGNPVMMVYVTRRISTKGLEIFSSVKNKIKKEFDKDIAVWADDIFWDESKWINDEKRKEYFDAAYCYNPYVAKDYFGNNKFRGNDYVDYVDEIYKKAFAHHECFIPTVHPRYNDRGVRLNEDHYVVDNIDFDYFLDKVKTYYKKSNLLLVTSFNEWYEDTQIEPCTGRTVNNATLTEDRSMDSYNFNILEKIKNFSLKNRSQLKVVENVSGATQTSNTCHELNNSVAHSGSVSIKIKTNELSNGTFFCINDNNHSPSMHLTIDKNGDKFLLRYARHSVIHDWIEYNGCTTSIENNNEYEIVLKYGEYNAISVNGELTMVDDERFDFKQFPTKNFSMGDVLRPQNNAQGLIIESVCFKDRQGKVYYEDENCNCCL